MEPLDAFMHDYQTLKQEVAALAEWRRQREADEPEPYLTKRQFCERFQIKERTLNDQLLRRESNGLADAIRQERPGAVIYINPKRYFDVVDGWKRKARRRRGACRFTL